LIRRQPLSRQGQRAGSAASSATNSIRIPGSKVIGSVDPDKMVFQSDHSKKDGNPLLSKGRLA
jgi:hypothetical protein